MAAVYYLEKVSTQLVPNSFDKSAGTKNEKLQWGFNSIGDIVLATDTSLYLLGWPGENNSGAMAGIALSVTPGMAGISAQGSF